MPLVLIVDDAAEARRLLRRALEDEGLDVEEAGHGEAALASMGHTTPPDLILLDLTMPGMGGFEVLSRLRRTSDVPVIVVSARSEESERVLALQLGADDYVVKPFLLRELPARVQAVVRRCGPAPPAPPLDFGRLVIRTVEHEIVLDETIVDVTPKEYDVLVALASAPRRVFSRDELLKTVWGSSEHWQDAATVTEHVRRLRRKLEDDPEQPRWIATVRGAGYRFEP